MILAPGMISCCTHTVGSRVQAPGQESRGMIQAPGMISCYTHSGVQGPSPWSAVNRYDAGTRYDIMLHTHWGRGSKPLLGQGSLKLVAF